MKQMRSLKKWVSDYEFIKQGTDDLEVLMEFEKSGDADTEEVTAHYKSLLTRLEDVEFRNMLSEEGDDLSISFTLKSSMASFIQLRIN